MLRYHAFCSARSAQAFDDESLAAAQAPALGGSGVAASHQGDKQRVWSVHPRDGATGWLRLHCRPRDSRVGANTEAKEETGNQGLQILYLTAQVTLKGSTLIWFLGAMKLSAGLLHLIHLCSDAGTSGDPCPSIRALFKGFVERINTGGALLPAEPLRTSEKLH